MAGNYLEVEQWILGRVEMGLTVLVCTVLYTFTVLYTCAVLYTCTVLYTGHFDSVTKLRLFKKKDAKIENKNFNPSILFITGKFDSGTYQTRQKPGMSMYICTALIRIRIPPKSV